MRTVRGRARTVQFSIFKSVCSRRGWTKIDFMLKILTRRTSTLEWLFSSYSWSIPLSSFYVYFSCFQMCFSFSNVILFNYQISFLSILTYILYDRELYSNNISGIIPSDLGNLTNLVSLDLYLNNFTGEIPDTLGKLTNLRFL